MDSGRSARESDGGDVRKISTSSSGEEGQTAKSATAEDSWSSGTGGVTGVGLRSPSVGDSEREVSSDPAVFDVVLRGGSPWGFYVCGGTEVGLPLQVSEVEKGGKAEVAKLCEGDIILQVNGIPCSSRLEGIQLVESAFRTLTLHVYRGSADAGSGESGGPRSPAFLQRLQEIQKREREKGQEFRREREKGQEGQRREREKGRVQDDSAVFRQSRSSQLQALRMKPRQRRGESFNVGKSPSGASAAPQQPISSRPFGVSSQHPHPLQQQQHPASQHHPLPQQQQQASWRERYQRPSEYGRGPGPASRPQLTPAKSSPSLNLPPEDPNPRSPPSPSSGGVISPAKSSPNLAEGGERERQFVQVHGKRPAMYEQPLSGRTVFPYPGAKAPVAWGADSASPGSPDKASVGSGHSSGLSNKSYDAGSQLSVSSSKSGDGASHKSSASYDAGSHVSGSSSRSGSSYGRRYSENFGMGGSGGASAGVGVGVGGAMPGGYDKQGAKYDDSYLMDSRRSKHERRSLPPHMLHKYQADYANVGSMGAGSLHSEKISEIDDTDDEFESDAPQVPPRPSPEAMGPPSSPPAPPVRDPSSLIQSKINQAHEKYPSWPVTKPNGANEQTQAINTRAQSWTDHTNTNKDFPSKKGPPYAPGLRTLAERNSPNSERKSDDGKSRNSSDPGLKTEFVYDHYGRVRQKPVEAGNKPRFEEFYNSKPGYPPPKLDSDGHNFGDKEYSVPSPPERDVPPVDQRTLTDKLTSPDTPPASGFPGAAGGDSGSKAEPVPSDSVKPGVVVSIPGSSAQVGSRPRTLDPGRERMYADSSTSPLEPKPSVFPITVSHDGPSKQTQMVLTQSKAYIVKQTPYYNTGTQTDMSPSYEAKTSGSADKKCNAEVQVSDFAAQTSPKSPVVSVQQPQPDPSGSSGERREAQRPTSLSSKFPPRSERSSGDYLNFPMKGPDGPQSQSSPKKEKPSADPFGFHSRGRDNQGPQSHSSPRYDRGSGGDYFSFPPRGSLGSQGEGGQPRSGSSSSAKGGGDYLNMPPRKDSGSGEPQWSRESLMAKYATDEVPGVEPSQSQAGDDPSSIIRALSKEYFAGHLRTDRRQASTSQETESLHSSSQGGMREAESCNSVVIHPMENLGPFAQGSAGGSAADFGSRSSLTDSRLDVSSVVSESSSKGSARGRYSVDPAQMARSRALADVRHTASSSMPYPGPVSSGGTPTEGSSERPKTLITSKSMGSLRPQLLSPTDSRSSGSVNVTRDSSPSGSTAASSSRSDFHSRTGSDSVFMDERRGSDSAPQGAAGRHMAMPAIGRTASMKKAYGTYDETERAFVRPGATSATSPTEEARSPTLPVENNTMTSGNYVQMNQIPRATRYSEPKPLDQIQEEGDVFSPEERAGARGSDRRSSDRTPTSPDREGLPGSRDPTGGPFPKGAEARPAERHPSSESRGGACGGAAASPPELPQPTPVVEDMPRRTSERSASISSQDDIYHRPPLAAQEEHSGRRYSDWNAVRQNWRSADASRQNTSLKRSTSEQIMPISAGPLSLAQPPNSARLADREARAAEAANRANASEEDLKRFQQMAVLNFMEMKTGQRMSSASVGSQDTIPSSPADSTATSNPYEQIGEHLAGGPAGDGSSVSDLISRTNEALAHRAQRTESFRRSGSSSSPSRHGSFNEYMEMSRSGALAVRKETEWSRLRTGLYPEQGASPGIGSIPGPSQRSSLCSDHHYEDINLLHLSSQRNSLQEPLPDDGSHPAYRQLFGRELQAGLEQAGGSGGMDSSMMAAHTYQNLGQRRPPPPPPPRSPSPERAPPALPPRMYRQQPSPVPATSPTLPPPHPGHPSAQPALPQRRPEARPQSPTPKPVVSGTESQVDETKIDFKTLVNQWESNSPREDNYVDELRRKARQHLPNATTAMTMSILHSKPNINLSQSFKREPVVSQEATPPNSLSPEGSEKSASLEEKDKAPQRPPPPNLGPDGGKFSSRVDMDATSLKTVSPTPPARSPPPPSGMEPGKLPLHQRPPPSNSHLEGLPPRRGEWGGGAEGMTSHDQDGGKPRSQSFDLLSQPSRNPPGPQESSPRMGPRGSLPGPTPSGPQGGEGKRRDRAWSEHGEGGRKFRHGSSSSNQSDERQPASLSRARTGSDAPLPSPPPSYGEEARGEEPDLPPPPVELLAGNPEFPDNSYGAAAFKNRANRQVGTYQRSSSEAILRPAPTYKIPSSSSTEFESARMGRSTWNSDSALVSQQGAPLPPRDSQTSAAPALPDRGQGPPLHDRHGGGGVSQDRSPGRLGMGPQLGSVQDGSSSGVQDRLGGSAGFVAHGRSSSQMSSSSSSSGELPRNVPAFKTETQTVRAVKSVAQPLQRAGQRSGYQGAVSNPVPVPARNGAVSEKQEVSGSVRSRIQTFEPSARVSSTAPPPSSSLESNRVFSRHVGSAPSSGGLADASSRSKDGGPSDRHRPPQDSQTGAGSGGVAGVPQVRVSAHPVPLPERTRGPAPSGDRLGHKEGSRHDQPEAGRPDREVPKPPPDDLSLPLRSPSGSEASSGGLRREMRDTQSLPSTPGSSVEDSGRLSSGHSREPSQEELECDKQARELAKELENKDSKLSAVLKQDAGRMQFMDGLFSSPDEDERRPATQPAGRRGPGDSGSSPGPDRQEDKDNKTVMPPSYFKSSPKALVEIEVRRNESSYREEIRDNDSLVKQKEELMDKLKKKLVVLEESREQLTQEIQENEKLGNQIWEMVQRKCKTESEKQKYKSYVADQEKIVNLLLNLAGQLARAENAVQSLAPDCDQKLRKMTLDKREKLSTKHEDAKLLKQDIDKRSEQVAMLLRSHLTEEEFSDYSYFVKMKSKLTIEFQELKDKITLGQEQMEELRRSIPSHHS